LASYIDLDGVRTWYDDHGAGDPLVLLHPGGGGVDSRAFAPNLDALAARFRTFTPERRGQGRTPDVDGPITFEAMAQDTIRFLEQVVGGPGAAGRCKRRRRRGATRGAPSTGDRDPLGVRRRSFPP